MCQNNKNSCIFIHCKNIYDQIENPNILVISDVHLGSHGSLKMPFKKFLNIILKKIRLNQLNNLEYIIFVGDLFDLVARFPDWYKYNNNSDYLAIIDLLRNINKKIKLFVLLGNHEIPVTGDYESLFLRRKLIFEQNLSDSTSVLNGINLVFCHYLLLYNNSIHNKLDLIPFDQIEDLNNYDISNYKNCNILFAHGYQFNSKRARDFAGKKWEELINSNDIKDKELTDVIFNDAKHLSLIDGLSELFENYPLTYEEKIKYGLRFIALRMWHKMPSGNDSYNKKIHKFIRRNKNLSIRKILKSCINHVIFGHTHNYQEELNYKNSGVYITNSGGFITHPDNITPNFVEINMTNKK